MSPCIQRRNLCKHRFLHASWLEWPTRLQTPVLNDQSKHLIPHVCIGTSSYLVTLCGCHRARMTTQRLHQFRKTTCLRLNLHFVVWNSLGFQLHHGPQLLGLWTMSSLMPFSWSLSSICSHRWCADRRFTWHEKIGSRRKVRCLRPMRTLSSSLTGRFFK